MNKVIDFFKWFNRPARIFEIFGYIIVGIGILITIIGILAFIFNLDNSVAGEAFSIIIMGPVIAIVSPQIFFAISKVLKAAEKYLNE